jgi:hypothetical protein
MRLMLSGIIAGKPLVELPDEHLKIIVENF